jgi:hypothetical protein
MKASRAAQGEPDQLRLWASTRMRQRVVDRPRFLFNAI